MKKIVLFMGVLIASLSLLSCSQTQQEVVPLTSSASVEQKTTSTSEILKDVVNSGKYEVVSLKDLATSKNETNVTLANDIDQLLENYFGYESVIVYIPDDAAESVVVSMNYLDETSPGYPESALGCDKELHVEGDGQGHIGYSCDGPGQQCHWARGQGRTLILVRCLPA